MAFEPVNDIERSLLKAVNEPAHRPQFLRDLLEAELLVAESGPPRQEQGRRTLQTGQQLALINIQYNGQQALPVFTSPQRVGTFFNEPTNYLAMNGRALLEMVCRSYVLLNPGTVGKEFPPDEISSLLDGSIFQPQETHVVQKDRKVLMGQPKVVPTELLLVLGSYFQTTPKVQTAYLILMHDVQRNPKPHTLIAVELSGEPSDIFGGAGIAIAQVKIPDPPVDFMVLDQSSFAASIRRQYRPFYQKKKKFLGLF